MGKGEIMPFYSIPNNAAEFKQKFAYAKVIPARKKVIDLIVKINELHERKSDKVKTKGSFLYYDDLVFVHTTKRNRGHCYSFFATDTMKRPIRDNEITKKVLNKILGLAWNRGNGDALFWEFYTKPGNIWTSALSQAWALELFSHDASYIRNGVCDRILKTFDIDWRQGGVYDPDMDWYLEYPMYIEDNMQIGLRRVLNGHMETLIVLYRYYKKTGSEEALRLFNRGLASLKMYFSGFIDETGKTFYSFWQGTNPKSSIKNQSFNDRYHHHHVSQLYRLYTTTKDEFFMNQVKKMMKIKPLYLPYCLTSYSIEYLEFREKDKCCPNCKIPEKRCHGCGV